MRDRTAGITARVSVASGGGQATGPVGSLSSSLSANGQYVAFASAANNLVANDTNNDYDVFMRGRLKGETTRVSVDSAGAHAAGGTSESPSISAGGGTVAFRSSAVTLVRTIPMG